jgi:hypothetical protein
MTSAASYHGQAAVLDLVDGVLLGVQADWVEGEGVDEARLQASCKTSTSFQGAGLEATLGCPACCQSFSAGKRLCCRKPATEAQPAVNTPLRAATATHIGSPRCPCLLPQSVCFTSSREHKSRKDAMWVTMCAVPATPTH